MWLLSLAALFRLAYLFFVRPPFETMYWALSTRLIHDGSMAIDGVKFTDFEPLYPVFLTVTRLLSRDHVLVVQIAQAVTASIGSVYIYRLAHTLTGRAQVAAIAASLYAIDPLLIRQAAAASDLALATTLLVAFAYYFVSSETAVRSALAGSVLGLVVLTRSMTLPLVLFAVVILMAARRFRAALALTVAVLVFVLPFPIRNHSVNGSWGPTRSGLNLYIGNSPYSAALLPDYDLDILEDQASALIESEVSPLFRGSPQYNTTARQTHC